MSRRTKRKLEDFDPNASDPADSDFDITERNTPQRRRHRPTPSSKKNRSKRQRRTNDDSDIVDDSDEIEEDDSFTDRSSSEDVEINPATGRSVRRTTKKAIKYEESDEDEIEDTPSADSDEEELPLSRRREKAKGRQGTAVQSIETLVVKLKMPSNWNPSSGRALRTRTGSKSIARGKTPDVGAAGTRRSSRLSHDVEAPIVALSDSGKHVNVVRQGTRSPEPLISRATRGGKGPRVQHPSAIMETSQEGPPVRDNNTPGPLDVILGGSETQVQDSHEASPEHQAQIAKDEDDEMEGVIQESQNEGGAGDSEEATAAAAAEEDDDEEEEEGPVTRGGRSSRPRAKSVKRKRGVDESSDFEPAAEDEKEDDNISDSVGHKEDQYASDSGSGSGGRRSARLRARNRRSQRSRRNSGPSDQESMLDADELAEEAQELATTKRRRFNRNGPDSDLVYDSAPKLRNRARNTVDYRLIRPEQNDIFDDDAGPSTERFRARAGGRTTYRSLFSNQGPFGGGLEGPVGAGAVGGIDSDSSDDEIQKAPRPLGGTIGMTPTTATGPGFAFPQTHNADPQQASGGGGGPANLGKIKDKKALADSDPLGVDPNVNFDGVGGLDDHINKLKEMVMLPLLYPEVFQRFKITPPRGVLFHGPPGTGKTLLARALASSVSSQGQKVTFYMRKGADALSKWVGEAERQLRMLFEEARKTQPSIIFFDEIDGLAPVRSSKQEQIHASIVATLLALMDGMDGRGQVIVIGATNRPDSVDPALRRPGRFDREFYFPLPNLAGRRAILDIHTKNWEPPLKDEIKDQLAELTKGYGGADLRALCTEAALNAVQGTFPQIYQSEKKLLIEPKNIKVLPKDFMISVNKMVPSSQRTVSAKAAPLAKHIEPLLRVPLDEIVHQIDELIPRRKKLTALEEAEFDDREDERGFERETTLRQFEGGRIFRPRLLISGLQGMGQQYLGAALLSKIEGLHVQSFDLPTILEDPTRTPEAAITQLFAEVRRHKPSVIYIPHVDVWYQTLPGPAIKTFKLLLRTLGANEPILLLGIMEQVSKDDGPDPQMLADLFSFSKNNIYELQRPGQPAREEFFNSISQYIRMSPADFPDPDNRKKRVLPELEPAPLPRREVDPQEQATKEKLQKKQDRMVLNRLKVSIQPVMDQLKKAYRRFFKPILDEAWYAYLFDEQDPTLVGTDLPPEQQQEQGINRPWELSKDSKGVGIILHVESGRMYYNLDLNQIEKRLSNGYYKRPKDFLHDIKTLGKDAKTWGDPERILKTNEMAANVEVDLEVICSNNPGLAEQCEGVHRREQERARKAEEKRRQLLKKGKEVPEVVPVPAQDSTTTAETSGPIRLGEPIPGQSVLPPITPSRLGFGSAIPLSNGTSTEINHSHQNGSTVPSRAEEDAHMTDSQDLNVNAQHEFQTPSRLSTQQGTQTQKSARTIMNPGSGPGDYHNSASTTTSGQKTSDRSSIGGRFNTQSTNGVTPAGLPDFSTMIPNAESGGSEIPDTQEVHYPNISSQASNSQPSQSSQPLKSMPAPAPPRHPHNMGSLLNDESAKPSIILDDSQLHLFVEKLVRSTSGLSLEQLEQVHATLMDTIWRYRAEYNRNKVIHKVQDAFNVVIEDIQAMQVLLKPSQENPDQSQFPGISDYGTQPPVAPEIWHQQQRGRPVGRAESTQMSQY